MTRVLICLVLACSLIGCVEDPNPKATVEKQGYTNVVITGKFYSCPEDDDGHYFKGKSPFGVDVSGVVCYNNESGSIIRVR